MDSVSDIFDPVLTNLLEVEIQVGSQDKLDPLSQRFEPRDLFVEV